MKPTLFSILIVLAIVSVVVTAGYVTSHQQRSAMRDPFREPPVAPSVPRVAGAGIVESSSQNIHLGSFVTGIISKVAVAPSQMLKSGDLLFQVDSRTAEANLAVQEAAVRVAQQQLEILKSQPRAEDIPIAEAKVKAAEARRAQQATNLDRLTLLSEQNAISNQELESAIEANTVAIEELNSAKAELTRLNAGAWQPEIDAAEAALAQAIASRDQAQVMLSQYSVLAPIDGQVLQVNVRVGEYVSGLEDVLVVFGDTSSMNVRVDIDEVDIPRFENSQQAIAYRRGDADHPIHLALLRIEPLVIPKQTLTGESLERIDTRVLQAIFKITDEKFEHPIYVGQQLDVFAAQDLPPQ